RGEGAAARRLPAGRGADERVPRADPADQPAHRPPRRRRARSLHGHRRALPGARRLDFGGGDARRAAPEPARLPDLGRRGHADVPGEDGPVERSAVRGVTRTPLRGFAERQAPNGSSRARRPVRANSALATAGATGGTPGSPMPPIGPPESTNVISMRGVVAR